MRGRGGRGRGRGREGVAQGPANAKAGSVETVPKNMNDGHVILTMLHLGVFIILSVVLAIINLHAKYMRTVIT